MMDGGARLVAHVPARVADARAQVGVLAVQEEVLVHPADLRRARSRRISMQAPETQSGVAGRRVGGGIAHQLVGPGRVRPERGAGRAPARTSSAGAGSGAGSSASDPSSSTIRGAAMARAGIRVEHRDEGVEGVCRHPRVGVEQEHVRRARPPRSRGCSRRRSRRCGSRGRARRRGRRAAAARVVGRAVVDDDRRARRRWRPAAPRTRAACGRCCRRRSPRRRAAAGQERPSRRRR